MKKLKIIINTNKNYKVALNFLMESMIQSDLENFNDIIIVISESDKNIEPELVDLDELIDFKTKYKVVKIETTLMNYDYTGLNALNLYNKHILVESDYYFYLLDTTRVNNNFYERLKRLLEFDNSLITTEGTNANILLFNNDFINYYGDTFNRNLNKHQAVKIEWNLEVITDDGIKIKNPRNYKNITLLPERVQIGFADVYRNGNHRKIFYYPHFGVYKYVFWGKDGDIKGKIEQIPDIH